VTTSYRISRRPSACTCARPANPLSDYLDSLRLIGRLEAELVLPGHGEPFHGLPERTDELLAHHQRRLEEIVHLLSRHAGESMTGYAIASRMSWSRRRTWDDLTGFERRMAVSEGLAHIELLHARGQVEKHSADARCAISYRPRCSEVIAQ